MANINVGRGPEWYFVGADLIRTTILNTMAESEVKDYLIPADTVLHGIMIEALVRVANATAGMESSIFRIKVGVDGAEVEINQVQIYANAGTNQYLWIKAVVDDLDWTTAQSVSITCANTAADANLASVGYTLLIMGF